jgi:hypothetical protein
MFVYSTMPRTPPYGLKSRERESPEKVLSSQAGKDAQFSRMASDDFHLSGQDQRELAVSTSAMTVSPSSAMSSQRHRPSVKFTPSPAKVTETVKAEAPKPSPKPQVEWQLKLSYIS